MPETIILPTATPGYHHFIPTPTPFMSVLATPSAPATVGVAGVTTNGPRVDWMLMAVVAGCVVVAAVVRFARRMR